MRRKFNGFMKYRWEYIPQADKERILYLATKLKVLPVVANLFINRGIETYEQAVKFFDIKYADLYDPFLMRDMDKAVRRFKQALDKNEKIMIFGDYDVDGTTGTAMLYRVLKHFYNHVIYYIPDRYSEGYGVSRKGVDFAKEQGIGLIISIDCGIKAIENVEYAKSLGIDFIVMDHHTPGDELPGAYAVLDPKRKDCPYPFKELTGCGVGFKFLQALAREGLYNEKVLAGQLELLALSIAADIVPIVDENRILAYYGLKQLNNQPSAGLRALKKVSGFEGKQLNIGSIVFGLAPRINAAGRIEHGNLAVELLVSDDYDRALDLAKNLDKLNKERQQVQADIVAEALDMFERSAELRQRKSTVLFNPGWHKGVVGIAASKVIDYHYKPTIILTKSGENITGSARSVADFDLYAALENCQQWLVNFGGHKYAAGLTLEAANLEKFIECFEQSVSSAITEKQTQPVLRITGNLRFDQIEERLLKILSRLEPYGPGNPKPVFATLGVKETGYSHVFGRKGDHLLLTVRDSSGKIFSAKGFGMAKYYDDVTKAKSLDIAYTIGVNEYKGRRSTELELKDIIIR